MTPPVQGLAQIRLELHFDDGLILSKIEGVPPIHKDDLCPELPEVPLILAMEKIECWTQRIVRKIVEEALQEPPQNHK